MLKKLNIGSIIKFKYDYFPGKKDQAAVVINIENNIYNIRFDWIDRQKYTELYIHALGMNKYFYSD